MCFALLRDRRLAHDISEPRSRLRLLPLTAEALNAYGGVNSSIEPQFAPASLRENDRAGHGVVAIVGSMSTDATLANVRGDVSELVKPGGLLGQQSADQGILRYRM